MAAGKYIALLSLGMLAGCYAAAELPDQPASTQRSDAPEPPMLRPRPTGRTAGPDAPEHHAREEPRWILTGDLVNARDLGGAPAEDGRTIAYGGLFRGPPLALAPEGCAEFSELGIRTVIDLRIASERDAKPNAPCVHDSAQVVDSPLPVPYNVSGREYLAILETHVSIATIFAELADRNAYPIYLHCTYGRDRTGVLAAVILRALGVPREDVLQEYLLSQPLVGAYPHSLEVALDALEDAGGIEAYLASAGVSDDQLTALRERMLSGGN